MKPEPLFETLRLQTIGITLINLQVETVIDKLGYKLIKEKAETVGDTRGHLETRL